MKLVAVKIEKLQAQEVEAFWPVFAQVLKEDFPGYSQAVIDFFLNEMYTPEAFTSWLAGEWKIVFVAKMAKKVVGFAVLDRPYGGVCFCRWLGVLKKYQKQGIGKKLVQAWLDYSQEYGCHKVEISSQPEAREFYQKCGLKSEGIRKLSYFGIDLYIFGKVIGPARDEVMTKA